jgi:hypothetical protein
VILPANVESTSQPVILAASSKVIFWGGDVARWDGFSELKRHIAERPRTSDYASLIEPTSLNIELVLPLGESMNWKSIIATALITGVVTIATGMLLFWWQTEKTELTYNSIQSIPFDDSNNKLFIQQVEITNSGDRVVEDVVFVLSFSDGVIQKSKITINGAISHKKRTDERTVELKIDSLNPRESASVSVIFQSSNAITEGGGVSLRGKGVAGKPIGTTDKNNRTPIFISLMAAYAGVFAFLLSTEVGRRTFSLIFKAVVFRRSLGSANEQKDVIASLLAMYGYPEKAKEYLQFGIARQYWVEADLLASEAIVADDKVRRDIIDILKQISELDVIFDSSKAIVLYNIARIAKSGNINNLDFNQYLELAKNLDKNEITKRIKIDPVFKMSSEANNECA